VNAKRIYANRGLARRANISLVVVFIAFVFGAFEIWRAANAGPEGPGSGYLFAMLFIGGGFYGFRQVMNGNRDSAMWLDLDDARNATIGVWQPFSTKRISGPASALTGWRPYSKRVQRNLQLSVLLADHPGHPRPVEFELGSGVQIDDAFKALAGEAFEAGSPPGQQGREGPRT